MAISEQLSQQKFQEILVNTYLKGTQNQEIKVMDMIEEIKQQMLKVSNEIIQFK